MEYHTSLPIPRTPGANDLDGLCPDTIPLRVHRNASLADRGSLRAQRDWQHVFGSVPPKFAGTMGPEHNFVSTCMPETLADRLELVAYATELVLLVDDMVDETGTSTAAAASYMPDLLFAYNALMAGGEVDGGGSYSPLVKLLVDAGRAMMEVDSEGAKVALEWLKRWATLASGSMDKGKSCQNLDEYLEYRRVNIGSAAALGLFIFATGLRIPEEQQQICLELSRPLWMQTALANDCHSWDRERQNKSAQNGGFVANAIWVLMHKHSMTRDEAMTVCRAKANEYAAEYLRVLESLEAREDLCWDAKSLLQALQFGMSGNVAWGLQCLRYHPERELTPAQIELTKAVWADEAIGWQHGGTLIEDGAVGNSVADANLGIKVTTNGAPHVAAVRDVPALGTEALEAPSRYLDSLPGKGIRDKVVNALNDRFKLPAEQVASIKRVVSLLHGASLMMDDIQDSSQLRRGKPAAHMVFGPMLTINAAGYRFLDALTEVMKLGSDRCLEIFRDELRDLYIGQSHDLSWTSNLDCPTEEEYLAMVDNSTFSLETAGLFRMLARMMDAQSNSPNKPDIALLTRFMTLLGRLFQIRDDYMNLTSADYTKQKGFCEDLDEGKYSLPVIHALGRSGDVSASPSCSSDAMILRNLLSQRHAAGRMSLDQKKLFLEHLERAESLEYTRQALDALQAELRRLATQMGMVGDERIEELMQTLKV